MSFKKDKYLVIKKVIDKDLALFLNNYLCVKKQVYDTCIKEKYISSFETMLGFYEEKNIKFLIPIVVIQILLWKL